MTEPLPVTLPCGCTVENQHICPPPWVDAEEWAAALAYRAGDGWHDEVCS